MASYVPYLPFVALTLVAFVECGGRISVRSTVDAGADGGAPVTGPPDGTVPFRCPDPAAVGGGAACDTSSLCLGTGIGPCNASDMCPCVGGRWECATKCPGSGSGPFSCPDPAAVGSGVACDTTEQCPGTVGPCAALESCPCLNGQWVCGGVSCGTGRGSAPGSGSGSCFAPPGEVFPETAPGVYCPFSGPDGGNSIFCAAGEHCCEPPESAAMLSTCEPSGTACPVAHSTDWQCEGAPDCPASFGGVCCGTGAIVEQAPQPGCAPDGGTLAAYPYVNGFTGTACLSGEMCGMQSPPGYQVCSQSSECLPGWTCIPLRPKGNTIGYCGSGS